MKAPSTLTRSYHRTFRRYRKLRKRLEKQLASGFFLKQSDYARQCFLAQLKKLSRKLNHLSLQLKIAAAAGTVTLVLNTGTVTAQTTIGPFSLQPRAQNPLREPYYFNDQPAPVWVDLDNDGDLDAVVGETNAATNGIFRYFENIGTRDKPLLTERSDEFNPFSGMIYPYTPNATFADMDGDSDLDMLVGFRYGQMVYYKNTGSASNPVFAEENEDWNAGDKTGNPFKIIAETADLGVNIKPLLIDFDKDGDIDVIAGAYRYGAGEDDGIFYFKNDGNGNFSEVDLDGFPSFPYSSEPAPAVIDLDGDLDFDLVVGMRDGRVRYFNNIGNDTFNELTELDNPFVLHRFRSGFASPFVVDFDNDGDYDLFVGYGNNFKYDSNSTSIAYLENDNNAIFRRKTGLFNPFLGIADYDKIPLFFNDINGDGSTDLLIGRGLDRYSAEEYNGLGKQLAEPVDIRYLKFTEGQYLEIPAEDNPFDGISIPGRTEPILADLDGDGDQDIIVNLYNNILYFKNEAGEYFEQTEAANPFDNIWTNKGNIQLIDIDADGDLDLLLTKYTYVTNEVRFYKNVGTPTEPRFERQTGDDNPLNNIEEEHHFSIRLVDIDHDNDFDVILGEGGEFYPGEVFGNEMHFYENTGDRQNPVFIKVEDGLLKQGTIVFHPEPHFVDYDNDGDLDMFVAYLDTESNVYTMGHVALYKNENTAPEITTNATALNIVDETGSGSFIIDETLTLADEDNDPVIRAIVTLSGRQAGDRLAFTPQPGISGSYDPTTGVLLFTGKATIADYQTLLRSVRFEYSNEGTSGRRRTSANIRSASLTVTFRVYDIDNTTPQPQSRSISITEPNLPPVFQNANATASFRGTANIDLVPLVSDPEGSLDWSTLKIITPPTSGASATIDPNHTLTINYALVSFSGIESLTLEVCDVQGACTTGTISITVAPNLPPVFQNASTAIAYQGTASINLAELISDPNGNLNMSSLQILSGPASGAAALINASQVLTVQYTGIVFSGTETLTVQVCDAEGLCATATITIQVNNAPPVIQPAPVTATPGTPVTINLLSIISDPDGNLNPASLAIVQQPVSGAVATIDLASSTLRIDYTGVTFKGTDQLRIRACDAVGACTESTITIEVDVKAEVLVYNAVAPGSTGDNRWLRIINLPENNRVSIYNRWGDEVFTMNSYNSDNPGKRFNGVNNNGNELPTGTYFYKIDYPGTTTITGFLYLKQ